MKETLITIGIFLLLIVIYYCLMLLPQFFNIVNHNKLKLFFNNIGINSYKCNSYSPSLLSHSEGPYIAKSFVLIRWIFPYYIEDTGYIPFWYDEVKDMDAVFRQNKVKKLDGIDEYLKTKRL